jgi:hypothetical protein
MKKLIAPVLGLLILIGLTQCRSSQEKKIVGVWQLQELVINGTTLQGSSLGNWLWEFNDAGGYLTEVAGVREKGRYTLKGDALNLKITTEKDRPDQVYKVARLDSIELDLLSIENVNKQSMRFLRRKVSEVTGDKD